MPPPKEKMRHRWESFETLPGRVCELPPPRFLFFFYSPPPAGPVLPALRPAQLTGGHPGASGGGARTAGAEVTSLAPPPAPVCTRKASRRCGHTRPAPLCAPPRRQSRPPAPSPPSTPVGGWCPYCSPQTRRVHGARLSSASPPLSVHRPPGGVELTRVPPCGWGHVRRAVWRLFFFGGVLSRSACLGGGQAYLLTAGGGTGISPCHHGRLERGAAVGCQRRGRCVCFCPSPCSLGWRPGTVFFPDLYLLCVSLSCAPS